MSHQNPIAGLLAPLDLSHLYSRSTKNRAPSTVKQFYKYFAIPGIGQLAGGLPNDGYFPYDTLEAQVALPNRWKPSAKSPDSAKSSAANITALPESHLTVPHTLEAKDLTKKIDLASALQYGTSQGYPPLFSFVKEFTTKYLHPTIPYQDGADIILTCGSTDGFSKAIQCFNNEWSEGKDPVEEREGILVELFAYMGAVGTARARGMSIVPVEIDAEGMLASGSGGLEDILVNWDFSKGKRPHLLYTVTVGQNPTSGTLGMKRRKEIYALCSKYDIVIIEDDPYWYLQYPSAQQIPVPPPKKSSGFDFLDSLMPSYLSVDSDGRVVRLDTFSKTVAPGCRLGWITAQPAVVERIMRITETSTQQPCGFAQSMIAELLIGPANKGKNSKESSGWDVTGWVRWLEGLRGEYERRMIKMCDILEKGQTLLGSCNKSVPNKEERYEWSIIKNRQTDDGSRPRYGGTISIRAKPRTTHACPTCKSPVPSSALASNSAAEEDEDSLVLIDSTPLFSFNRPAGGMFLWLKVHFEAHPLFTRVPNPRLAIALWVFLTTTPYKVLVAPGTIFSPVPEIAAEKGWRFFRLCFAAVPVDQLEDISRRFNEGIAAFWEITDPKVIDELLKDLDILDVEAMKVEGNLAALTGFC